jgi:hypothetical protein
MIFVIKMDEKFNLFLDKCLVSIKFKLVKFQCIRTKGGGGGAGYEMRKGGDMLEIYLEG